MICVDGLARVPGPDEARARARLFIGLVGPRRLRLNVPLLDLKAQYATIKDEVDRALDRCIERQEFIMGPEVAELETGVAELSSAKHGIGCASGTDALLLPLKALGPRAGRRGDRPELHLLRHGRSHPQRRRQAGVRRHRAGHLQRRSRGHRGGDHPPDSGDRGGAPVRSDGRDGADPGRSPTVTASRCSRMAPRRSAPAGGSRANGELAGRAGLGGDPVVLPQQEPRRLRRRRA